MVETAGWEITEALAEFGQAAGHAFAHQRLQLRRPRDVGGEAWRRADRIDGLHGQRMTLRRAAQRAAGQGADDDGADVSRLHLVEQPAVILAYQTVGHLEQWRRTDVCRTSSC